ncbi:hypothetical protein E2320_002033, partial [Naja naja]
MPFTDAVVHQALCYQIGSLESFPQATTFDQHQLMSSVSISPSSSTWLLCQSSSRYIVILSIRRLQRSSTQIIFWMKRANSAKEMLSCHSQQ